MFTNTTSSASGGQSPYNVLMNKLYPQTCRTPIKSPRSYSPRQRNSPRPTNFQLRQSPIWRPLVLNPVPRVSSPSQRRQSQVKKQPQNWDYNPVYKNTGWSYNPKFEQSQNWAYSPVYKNTGWSYSPIYNNRF